MWKATIFLFHKNAFRGTIHCSAEVAQHRWPSGFPSDAGHSMHRVNSILMQAPKIMIFETAANLELWPKILPHYRYIRFLERGTDRNLVVMAAHAFRHSDLLDLGANHRPRQVRNSFSSFESLDKRNARRLDIFRKRRWCARGDFTRFAVSHSRRLRRSLNPIIGDFFIHNVANKTLRCMKAYVEARADKVTA